MVSEVDKRTLMRFAIKKVNILPAEPIDICGYGFSRGKSKACDDEIAAMVCVLDDGNKKLVFVSIDTCYVTRFFTSSIRQYWAEMFDIQKNCIVIAATHTHSGPGICHCPDDYLTGTEFLATPDYIDVLTEKLTSAVKICLETMQECTFSYGFAPIEQCFGNRNNEHGDYLKNSFFWKITDYHDREMAIIVILNSHSTILKGNYQKLSSDLAGRVRMELEKLYKIPVMVFMGAAGDVSTRFYVKEATQNALRNCAAKICNQIAKNINCIKTGCNHQISCKTICWNSEYFPKEDKELQSLISKCEKKFPFMLERMLRINSCEKIQIEVEIQLYAIGDINIVCIPGELLTGFARLLENSCHGNIAFICCANDYWQYFVPQDEYGEYFESYNSIFPKGEADKLILEIRKQIMR